ncbi:PEP-CTERM sorting domain-containing protein [Marinobacter salarius]|uniref:PEP-CTERM sorting domain-containing protein n=1 Tax=Marinobacter salarius TaxID=1420917 RepID=UPI003BAA0CFF
MKPSVLVGIVFLVVSVSSHAVPITNGDFSEGLTAWSDVSLSGSASVGSDETLTLGGGAGAEIYSASLWQGDNGFFQFSNPLSLSAEDKFLSFDVRLESQPGDVSESGTSLFADSLSLELYDSLDFTYDLFFQSGSDFAVNGNWSTVFLDISSLQGRDFALTINLFDEDDGFNSLFGLDNFAFTASDSPDDSIPVPEPASLGLLVLGLGALLLRRRSAKS